MALVLASIFLYNLGGAKPIPKPGCSPANVVVDKTARAAKEVSPPEKED